jgi:predicted nucleotidyltransferase
MIIRDKDKLEIINLGIQTIKTPAQIWAFGSRVNGDAHDTSDLDLVIVPDDNKKLDINELMSFKDSLRESNIPILVQAMDWNRIPKSFYNNILNNYEVVVRVGNEIEN